MEFGHFVVLPSETKHYGESVVCEAPINTHTAFEGILYGLPLVKASLRTIKMHLGSDCYSSPILFRERSSEGSLIGDFDWRSSCVFAPCEAPL